MKNKKNIFFLFGSIFLWAACGTHGSLKSYRYNIQKDSLQQAIMIVIKNNPNIYRDTSLDYLGSSALLDHPDSGSYSAGENFYNDIKHYVTIKIKSGDMFNEYTFRYFGADEDWKNANSSEIFICYAYDKDHKGGSETDGKVSSAMLKRFTNLFEKEFVDKIDLQLHMSHTEAE